MTDRLTQLQDAVDQIATQFFSALRYVHTHHENAAIGDEPLQDSINETVDKPDEFKAAIAELSRDLIVKTKQIEVLITSLPGIGVSEEEQKERLRTLEEQLRDAEEERVRAVLEKEEARERLESVVVKLRRV